MIKNVRWGACCKCLEALSTLGTAHRFAVCEMITYMVKFKYMILWNCEMLTYHQDACTDMWLARLIDRLYVDVVVSCFAFVCVEFIRVNH